MKHGGEDEGLIDSTSGRVQHCLELNSKWHTIRYDMEILLERSSSVGTDMTKGFGGTYKIDNFEGHCDAEKSYLPIGSLEKYADQIRDMYG